MSDPNQPQKTEPAAQPTDTDCVRVSEVPNPFYQAGVKKTPADFPQLSPGEAQHACDTANNRRDAFGRIIQGEPVT